MFFLSWPDLRDFCGQTLEFLLSKIERMAQ